MIARVIDMVLRLVTDQPLLGYIVAAGMVAQLSWYRETGDRLFLIDVMAAGTAWLLVSALAWALRRLHRQ